MSGRLKLATISVIVPVFNRAGLLPQTLEALANQSRPPDEIIVVDDGSDDDSAVVAESFGHSVRVIRIRNSGPAHARNRGLSEATGEFIQFMDSDDLPTPRYLEARLNALMSTGSDIAYGAWAPAWINGRTIQLDGFVRQARPTEYPLDAFLRGWVLFLPNTMIRRSLLEDAGGYPEHLITGEDMLLLFRLLRRTNRLFHVEASVLVVRQHPSAQLSAAADLAVRRVRDEAALTRLVLEELLHDDRAPVTPSARALMQWRARALRAQAVARQLDLPNRDEFDLSRRLIDARQGTAALLQRMKTRIRYQLTGHRIDPAYQPAPLNETFREEISALGFNV